MRFFICHMIAWKKTARFGRWGSPSLCHHLAKFGGSRSYGKGDVIERSLRYSSKHFPRSFSKCFLGRFPRHFTRSFTRHFPIGSPFIRLPLLVPSFLVQSFKIQPSMKKWNCKVLHKGTKN